MGKPSLHTCQSPTAVGSSSLGRQRAEVVLRLRRAEKSQVPCSRPSTYECPTDEHDWFTEQQLRGAGAWVEEKLAP